MPTTEQFLAMQRGTTRICYLARLQAAGGTNGNGGIVRMALHTRKITFEGEVYKPAPLEVSEMEKLSGLGVDNAEVTTILHKALTRLKIKGTFWQGAEVVIMSVAYDQPEIGALRRHLGRFGETKIVGYQATIAYRGLMQMLGQATGWKTSKLCRYDLGVWDGVNNFCPVNLDDYTYTGTVTNAISKQKFEISLNKPDRTFYRGRITWTSGANAGLSMETQDNAGTTLSLFMPMLAAVANGDSFKIVHGDDKTLHICHTVFNAAIDHGGEDMMPSRETLYKIPEK